VAGRVRSAPGRLGRPDGGRDRDDAAGVGDVVALLTDGFYEYIGPGDEMFEKDRVAELVVTHHDRPASEILDAVLAAVTEFAKGCPQLDDMTAIMIKRL
jgi:sigma-B regulation protein RsbU (phosphoserine phosphatase)